jgi:hypothetical protein
MARLALVCCVFLLVAAPAAGKGAEYRLCGASGCKRLPADTFLDGLYGGRVVTPPAPASYYELRGFSHHSGREIGGWAYVPSAHAVRRYFGTGFTGGTWTQLSGREDARWRKAVRGLSPFAAPSVRRATVGGKPVRDPASYLALYAAPAQVTSFSGDPLEIVLESRRPSPWTGPAAAFAFYPREGVLTTAGMIFVLPAAVAGRVRQRVGLG